MDKENDLIHIAGIPTKRSDARIIINQAELAVRDLELSTDRAFAKYYFCLGWQAAIESQEATINTLNDASIEDKILAEVDVKLQAQVTRLERIIKDQRLLFDAREAGLEKIIREFKENT
jgi:hypothetical protein